MFYDAAYHPVLEDYDTKGKLSPAALLKALENAGNQQSDYIGDGVFSSNRKKGLAWILTDWQICVSRYPAYGAPIKIRTWQRTAKVPLRICRDYLLEDGGEGYAVRAVSRWVLLDKETQRIVRPSEDLIRLYAPEPEAALPESTYEKLQEPKAYSMETPMSIRRSDIDFNAHVHNLSYLDFAIEGLPLDVYEEHDFREIRILYKSAVRFGESVLCKYAREEAGHMVGIYGNDGSLRSLVALR